MVLKTSDDLPEPETPVNTVSRRLGISTLTSLRLFSRALWHRISSWLSATGGPAFGEAAVGTRLSFPRRAALEKDRELNPAVCERALELFRRGWIPCLGDRLLEARDLLHQLDFNRRAIGVLQD